MRLTNCTRSLLGIVTSLLNLSECLHMTVRPDKDATVTVSSSMLLPLEQCSVCKVNGVENDTQTTCHSSLVLVPDEDVTLLFNCTEPPQSAFGIQVHRKIECTNDTCSPATGVAQPSLFSEFIRTLVWDLSVPEKTIMSLDFPGDRLKEMTESELCQDGYQYAVTRTNTEGEVKTQTYCKNGLVAHLRIPSQATVSLQVQKGREVDSSIFTATAKPIKKQSRMISVTPEPGTIVTISRNTKAKECSVCVGEGPTCNPKELVLRAARNTSVKFTCPQPQDVFSVEINRGIDCTEITCTGNIVQAESSLFPDFNRTFTWDLKVPPGLSFQLDFPSPGMRQIAPSETCPDEHTYTIITYLRTGLATIGIFCPGGSITTVQVLYKGRVSLQVPRDRKLEPLDFKVTVGPEIKMLAVVKVNLPRGVSDSDFLSANYFRGFPDDDLMRWDFTVPGMHNYTVNFLNHTESLCRKKEVMVMYHKARGKVGIQKTLVDPQPTHRQGSFTMTLFNCETDRTKPGLSLKFRVSVMRSGHPVLCTVHLPEEEGPVLHFEKRGSDPYCEMRKDSVLQEKITVPSGTKARLSFLDCPSEDLRLTAVKTIGCQSLDSCSVTGTLLTVPKMPTCLPTLLQSFTWHLIIPVYGTVDLLSPTGNLRQSLPGQECNGSVSLHIAEGDGSSIGNFCSEGIIHKVQVHSNVSVTATAKDLSLIQGPFLNVSFSEEISDSIIYTVQPRIGSPALLATPNWPSGMKPYSTVSWIINLPGHLQADLLFTNISQPKCGKGHTFIKVQTLGSPEEILSRREDKEAEDKLMVPESFYLNMSNCMPEDGHFSVLSKVTLQKTSKLLLSGILGAVGAVVLLMLIVLTVCLVLRKKKRMMVNEASIYKGKGNIFIPGDDVFPKTQSDSESHIYASIEDTMVYSHLLREPSYVGTVQDHFQGQPVDTYRTFMALQDGVPEITETAADLELVPEMDKYRPFLDPSETFVPSRPRTPIDRQDSMGFTDRRMVDNELYTFKSTGDINTIRLSGVDQILDPEESI